MRATQTKLSTEEELYDAAIRSLARRAYSAYEMRSYLERRADSKDTVRTVLERLKKLDYLDDARYARQFVRMRSGMRKQGAFRIARDLRARGVADRHIDAALSEQASESNESDLVRARIARRIKSLRGPLDEKRIASLYHSLLRAGFSTEVIRRELTDLSKKTLPDVPDTASEEN